MDYWLSIIDDWLLSGDYLFWTVDLRLLTFDYELPPDRQKKQMDVDYGLLTIDYRP